MHLIASEFDWPKLRRELEDILAIINARLTDAQFNQSVNEQTVLSIRDNEGMIAVSDGDTRHHFEPPPQQELTKDNQPDKTNDLYDHAIVVLTEFGQVSPAILQMWLSIDYSTAMSLINRFQTEGLISLRGRVRHKAFSLRRSLDQPPQ